MSKLFKNKVDDLKIEKQLVMPKFIKFFVKINFLPIQIIKEEIVFKVQSRSFMIHFIIYWFPLLFSLFYFWILSAANDVTGKMSRVSTFAEEFASYSTLAVVAAIIIPTRIAKGIDSLPLKMILNPTIEFPRHGAWTLLSFLMMSFGSNIYMTGLLMSLGMLSKKEASNRVS